MKPLKISVILIVAILAVIIASCTVKNQPHNSTPGNQQQNQSEEAVPSPSDEVPHENQGIDTQEENQAQPDGEDAGIDEICKLLPVRDGYQWSYNGFAEYGHQMILESISRKDNTVVYSISGKVDDMSGGESKQDLSFTVIYTVKPGVLIQNKTGRAMMDTGFKDLELIRTPLQKGNTWLQKTTREDGTEITLKSTITDVREENGQKIYTVIYEDTQSEYYEKREIKEGVGILSYEKLYMDAEGNFPIGYYIYYPGTGHKNKLEIDAYLPKLNTQLMYFGFAEYGHVGVLKKISSTADDAIYEFQGMYQDGSGIEDKFTVRYYIDYIKGTVTERVMSSTRFDPPKINSKLHNLVILKTPFEQGKTWSHSTKINGKEYKVTAKIKEYDPSTGRIKVTYTVKGVPGYFQNTYIEERVFEPGRGMVGFSNLMPGDIPISEADLKDSKKLEEALVNHMFGYSLNPEF